MTVQDKLDIFKNEIISDYQNGISTSKLAIKYNCNSYYIWHLLKKNKINIKSKQKFKGNIEDHKDKIIELFNMGYSAYKIGKEINISKPTILRYLKKNNLSTTQKQKRNNNNLLKDKKELIFQLHKEGKSTGEIARELGHGQPSVWKILNKEGLKTPNYQYTVDVNYFKKIDTQIKAYILGFAYADGNTTKTGKFRIGLQEGDKEILEQIKAALQYTGPMYYKQKEGNRYNQWELCINRKEMTDKLIKLGCMPAKSMVLTFPTADMVPKYLIWHFIRGYFDGDGSLSGHSASIVGTYKFIQTLIEKFQNYGIYSTSYQRYKQRALEDSSHQLFINRKEDKERFLRLLYTDSHIHLKRKYEKAVSVLPELSKRSYTWVSPT
jgi:DNA invertase Pin-like site-specific DNA recombinase